MPSSPSLPCPVRFGDFELDVRAGELRKDGARVPLAEQPLRLLEVLLEHPGVVVSREQLRQRLWPADTFVDFEHGLNAAVKRLRDALGDAAETPRFIETVPKRGYRFVAPTERYSAGGSGARQRSALRALAWASAGALVTLLVTLIVGGRSRLSQAPGPLTVTSVVVEQLLLGQPGIHFAVAPGGRTVAFAAGNRVFRRDLDRVDPEPIEGTVGGSDVFFSEDGRSIGFETGSELWTASLDGGTPRKVLPNQPLRGGTWGKGDRIVVGRVGSGLWMTSATGGEPRQLTVPAKGERHELPQMLPGGRVVLFTILSVKDPARAAIHLLDTGETRHLFEGTGARFIGSGHVVFGLKDKLWAVGFDTKSLQTRGPARPVRDDVRWSGTGYPQFAIDGGLLAYVRTSQPSVNPERSVPTLVNRQGKPQLLGLPSDNYLLPRFSPAGDRLVMQVGATRELWIYDLGLRNFTRLISDRIVAYSAPAWTPDGRHVVFTTWFDGQVGFGRVRADGSGPVEPLLKGIGLRSFERTHPVILPDTSGVILTGLSPGASSEDLLIARLTGDKRLDILLQAPGVERNAAIASSGRFVAYDSNESGRPEVYVRPFPGIGTRRWQVSAGGAFPVWTRGGREIVYVDGQGRIMAATVRPHGLDESEFSRPRPLFTFGAGMERGVDRDFDVTNDGERFLFLVAEGAAASKSTVELVLVQNWVQELERLVPREP